MMRDVLCPALLLVLPESEFTQHPWNPGSLVVAVHTALEWELSAESPFPASCPVAPSLCDMGTEFSRPPSLPSHPDDSPILGPASDPPQPTSLPLLPMSGAVSILKPGSPSRMVLGVGAGLPPEGAGDQNPGPACPAPFNHHSLPWKFPPLLHLRHEGGVCTSSAPPLFPVSFH